MSLTATEPTATPHGSSDGAGYFDGEHDAISQLPAAEATARASMADAYDPLWAQGYADGYLNQIQVTYALTQQTNSQPTP